MDKKIPCRTWNSRDIALFKSLYEQGKSAGEIMETMNLGPKIFTEQQIINRILKDYGEDRLSLKWGSEVIEAAVSMFRDGLSFLLIARRLSIQFRGNFTKNEVLGKLRRRGFIRGAHAPCVGVRQKSHKRLLLQTLRKFRRERNGPKRISGEQRAHLSEVFTSGGVPMSSLGFPIRECRWPGGHNGSEMLCCGKEVVENSSYCEFHTSVSISSENPNTRSRQANRLGSRHRQRIDHIGAR